MFVVLCHSKFCCDPPEEVLSSGLKLTCTHNSLSPRHGTPEQGILYFIPCTQTFFFLILNKKKITHIMTNTHSLGSQSADTRAMTVIWLQSTGTAEVRTRRWKQQENATLGLVCTNTQTHTHTLTQRDTTHVPVGTKADYNLTRLNTMTHSQLSAH